MLHLFLRLPFWFFTPHRFWHFLFCIGPFGFFIRYHYQPFFVLRTTTFLLYYLLPATISGFVTTTFCYTLHLPPFCACHFSYHSAVLSHCCCSLSACTHTPSTCVHLHHRSFVSGLGFRCRFFVYLRFRLPLHGLA